MDFHWFPCQNLGGSADTLTAGQVAPPAKTASTKQLSGFHWKHWLENFPLCWKLPLQSCMLTWKFPLQLNCSENFHHAFWFELILNVLRPWKSPNSQSEHHSVCCLHSHCLFKLYSPECFPSSTVVKRVWKPFPTKRDLVLDPCLAPFDGHIRCNITFSDVHFRVSSLKIPLWAAQ